MSDTRKKDFNWTLHTNADGTTPSADAQLAVLMDIRDELKSLVRIFRCPNFQGMPWDLKQLIKNTKKPGRRKVKLVGAKRVSA